MENLFLVRLIENLRSHGISRLVVVTGYLESCVRDFIEIHKGGMQVDYVFNPTYQTTNNIYSLWLARQAIQEPFLLLESDLVFESGMLKELLKPDKIAISHILPWMNGTTVSLNAGEYVTAFHGKGCVNNDPKFKTVNIYSLSLKSWQKTIVYLDRYIADERVNEYYEAVFSDMVADKELTFDTVFFDKNRWYEIDTIEDLHQAELIFPRSQENASVRRWLEPLAADIENIGINGKILTT